jgi:hypothetical protein
VELLAEETNQPRKFFHQLEPRAVGIVTAALVPIVAVLAFSHCLSIQTEPLGREHIDTSISGSLWSLVSALGLVVGCAASLELVGCYSSALRLQCARFSPAWCVGRCSFCWSFTALFKQRDCEGRCNHS